MNINLIDSDDDSLQELLDCYNNLPVKAQEQISGILINKLNELLGITDDCQTPIEKILAIALDEQINKILPYYVQEFFFKPQYIIECEDKKYRVDFFIKTRIAEKQINFVIECDGHDFHEKTKEQAKKDKQRERDLMKAGNVVIRFTGSEIVKNPIGCAREVIDIILNNFE
jgi:very-short-patch-repair endonuclease